jgi:hypothetical protein
MKRKISTISGLGIVILLLISLLALAVPASADTSSWSAEPIPSTISKVLGPAGIDVCDIAVAGGGNIIYAVTGDSTSDNVVYKSNDVGNSWTTLDINIKADLIAVAPDDADLVAIANSSIPEVYLTTDGGAIWYALGTPQESSGAAAAAIYDLAISKASDGINYIAAAGKEAGDVANVWYFDAGNIAPVWKETNNLTGFSSADEVAAVAFSPNFPSDEVMLAISEDDNTSIKLQILSLDSKKWNKSAKFADYPITIVSDDGITGLTSASISLAADYQADYYDVHNVFVGLAISGDITATGTSGIYRLANNSVKALKTGIKIHSIAFNGTSLVAGCHDTNTVYRSANPLETIPTVSPVSTIKGPGGENKVVVAWAGSKIVAGTSGNESAFAVSKDSGANFNDISLIDTAITSVSDVAVSSDGSKVYLGTDDGADLSLWYKASTWKRILSQPGTADYLVRLAPDNANVIYLAEKGGTTIYHNKSGGEAKWYTRICPVNIQDLAVESTYVAYALDSNGSVSKTINAGFTWGAAKSTKLDSGATIVSVSANNLLVGSQDGYVAYSTDGNTFWTDISEILQSGAGKIQVVADKDFATNQIIYAASDKAEQNIKKWKIGTSTEWTDIFRNCIPGGIYGLAIEDGTLYALEFNTSTGRSTLWQCLSPTTATSTSSNWSSSATTASTDIDDAEVHLNATPRALKASQGELWAVKTNGTNKLYRFTDILIEITLRKPASGFTNPVNAMNGLAHDIAFSWERPSEATEYELQIAYDKNFYILMTTITIATEEPTITALVGPYQTGDARVNFMPGTTGYWRVRTTQPLHSVYSETRSFNIEPTGALVPGLLTPANGSTDISRKPSFSWQSISGTSEYHFVLDDNATMTSPVIDIKVDNASFTMTEELDYGTTYFWKVRATEPAESDWSTLANFTVKEKLVEPLPPPVVQPVPPLRIDLPAPPPPNTLTLPPLPATPAPVVPGYLRAVIITAAILLLAVIALIIKRFTARPIRVAEGFSDRLGKLREGMATHYKDVNPPTAHQGFEVRNSRTGTVEASQPLSFAAESFLWMTTAEEKEKNRRLLSLEEEQALGKTLASRIQAIAKDQLLYLKFPEDVAVFLYIWAHYGSRDETDRYLTNSLQSRPEHVIRLLKCYLNAPQGFEPFLTRQTDFSRTQYDALSEVVDPDEIYQALSRLYGPELDRLDDEALVNSSGKAIASQFARIHHQVKSEAEAVRADTR